MEDCKIMMNAENAAPQIDRRMEQLDKLTKKSSSGAIPFILESLSSSGWEEKWHALKAVKRCGAIDEKLAEMLVKTLDTVYLAPTSKQTYYSRALDGALVSAGDLIAPHVAAIMQRALEPADNSNLDDDGDEEFERQLITAGASRTALASISKQITEEQAARCFLSLKASAAEERAAALEICTTAAKRFATPHLNSIVAASRDDDELVRAAAADALERCAGLSFEYNKGSAGFCIAQTRAEHQMCTGRLLELMREDPSEIVRENALDALNMLGYKEEAAAESVNRSPAKRTRHSQQREAETHEKM